MRAPQVKALWFDPSHLCVVLTTSLTSGISGERHVPASRIRKMC